MPIIPISDTEIKRYDQAIQRRKENAFDFGLKKDKLWGIFLFGVAVSIGLMLIRFMLRLEENMLYDYEQVNIRRYGRSAMSIQELEI